KNVDGTAAIVGALQQTLVLQVGDVFMHGCKRTEAQAARDLLVGRRVTVLLRETGEKIDDLFLPPCNSHAEIVANKRRIAITLLILPFFGRYGSVTPKVRHSRFEIGLCKKIHIRLVMSDAINHGGYTPSEDSNGDE